MRFNYIVSDTTLGGHKALFGVLREQNDGKNRHIFVVPDRFTLGVEREICEALYPDGTFNVDVCSFTRMAQKALGKKNRACLSKEGTVLLLNRIIRENNDSLGYYKDVKSVAFSREMFASIASLRSSGISSERVEEGRGEIKRHCPFVQGVRIDSCGGIFRHDHAGGLADPESRFRAVRSGQPHLYSRVQRFQ